MLADVDDTGELLDCVLADGPGSTLIDLDIDNNLFKSFLEKHNVSLNVLFSSVFAYTLSRFVGCEKVLFNIVENGRDRYGNYNSIGMFVNTLILFSNFYQNGLEALIMILMKILSTLMQMNY